MTRDNDTLGDMTSLLAALVSIDSVNPDLIPGGAGERAVADAIAQWGSAAGLEVETLTEHPERPSVVVRARGSGRGGTLLLCGHIDTVGVAGMTEPFDARVDGDRLHGRGAYDMKGGVAAALLACRDAATLGLAGDVVVAAVADEEHASVGVREVLRHVRADAAIVTEPTELEVAIAHRGFVWIEIEVRGRAAHGSRPRLGVDAIAHAGPILTGIGDLDSRLAERPHPLLDRGSIHASLIEGGTELSSYPDRCRISLERRTLPGEASASVEAEIEEILAGTRGRVPGLRASQRTLLVREPFEIDADAELVGIVAVAASANGVSPSIGGASYWADAAFIDAAGIPCVLFGPAGEGAHATEEWVSLSSCEAVRATLVDVARHVCR